MPSCPRQVSWRTTPEGHSKSFGRLITGWLSFLKGMGTADFRDHLECKLLKVSKEVTLAMSQWDSLPTQSSMRCFVWGLTVPGPFLAPHPCSTTLPIRKFPPTLLPLCPLLLWLRWTTGSCSKVFLGHKQAMSPTRGSVAQFQAVSR